MILITGGLGFIGAHTTRALLELGEECVVGRFRSDRNASFLPDGGWFAEPLDCTDLDALRAIGKKYPVTGIVHLAGVRLGSMPVADELEGNLAAVLNVLRVAAEWGVPRVTLASSIGVYGGVSEPVWREDAPLPLASAHAIPASKKVSEVVAGVVAAAGDFEAVHVRIGAIWGPLGRATSRFIAAPALVHAAVRGTETLEAYAEDAIDLCYVRDCGRAIASVQTAEVLQHDTYNIGGGAAVTNARFADALRAAVPGAGPALLPGRGPLAVTGDPFLNIARLTTDTEYRPAYDLETAVADYAAWLGAGNPL
jgi:UDP-glucose 4-epimerase